MNDMIATWLAAVSLVGGMFLLYCIVVGAYVVLRWGYSGVALVWRMRQLLDNRVSQDARETIGREG